MVEAFYHLEASEGSQFKDIFLAFGSPFKNPDQYTQALTDEFRAMLKEGASQLEAQQVHLPFRLPAKISDPVLLFTYFQQFVEALTYLQGDLVLWLHPLQLSDSAGWEQWLIHLLEKGLPPRVHVLLSPFAEECPLTALEASFPEKVWSDTPDLDMEGAMRQMATGGNPKDPGVQFRKWMVEMNLAGQKGRLAEARAHGEQAIAIAQQQAGWEHLEVAVWLALAGMQPSRHADEAEACYDKARRIALRAKQQGHPAGTEVLAQANFGLAAFCFKRKHFERAAELYEEVTRLTGNDPQFAMQQMEAFRMAGYCHRRQRRSKAAWDAYWQALETAELLTEETRRHSTLPYIGAGLLEVMAPANHFDKEPLIRQKLASYLGPDWEKIIEQHQSANP